MLSRKRYKNITSLARLLTLLAVISIIAVVSLTGLGMNKIYSRQVIQMAEEESVLVSALLVDDNLDTLVSRNDAGNLELKIDPLEVEWLNQRFSDFLKSLDIVKVKIFSLDARIIYSTENDLIGQLNQENRRLRRALAGELDSHLEVKGEIRDLSNELALNVDVVETYIPVTSMTGEILGAFELYMDVTKFRKEIREGTQQSLFLLTTVLLVVFLITYGIGRIAMKHAADAEEKLRKLAMIDNLTGILNRGELMSRAEKEISRIGRLLEDGGQSELSLVMIDIDHFKLVNDRHGHQCGDSVLRQVADWIQGSLRPYDIVGRYGGEEFLLLLPGTGLSSAMAVSERIRCAVAERPFVFKGVSLNVTISLGVATISSETPLLEVISRADQALYAAKENGRNRVEQYPVQGSKT